MPWPVAGVLALIVGPLTVVGLRMAFVARVILSGEELIVRNPFKTHRLPLLRVKSVEPGYSGTVFTMYGGSRVTAWAVQKSNIATWTKKRTRADEMVDAVVAGRPGRAQRG